MSLDRVKEYLKKYNMDDKIIEVNSSTATVELAARALNTEEDRIAKTLSFWINDKPILIVLSGNSKIDNKKYKSFFNTKAKMIDIQEVEKVIGHAVGGVCPFGINEGVDIYLDESLKKYDTVYPACGEANTAIEISINDLERVVPYKEWINVSK
ncbi:MAG: YbaK/EbsC family protein [Bacilli bacterium]|nr:YbaK/EbsC family protein [Bacilli bacterium]